MLLAKHTRVSAQTSPISNELILTLFLSLHRASLCSCHGNVASVTFNSENHWPVQHLTRSTMHIYNRCLVTHSESKHPFCSLLYTAPTLCTSYSLFNLSLLTSRLLVLSLLSLLLPLLFFPRLLLFLGAVLGAAAGPSENFVPL